jgi:hypothetical protein
MKHANIQVKTSFKRVTSFPMPASGRISASRRSWYVLLRWLPSKERFEGFMLSGREARKAVEKSERAQWKRMRKGTRKNVFPGINVAPNSGAPEARWRKTWLQWKL